MRKKRTLENRIHANRRKAPIENVKRRRRKNTSEFKDKLSSEPSKSRTEYDDEDVTSSQSQAVNRKEIEEDLARDLGDTESLVVSRG